MFRKPAIAIGVRLALLVAGIILISQSIMSDAFGAPKSKPMAFEDIPGWQSDDHLSAISAFIRSCMGPPLAIREDWDAHRLAEESRGVETGGFEPRQALRTACTALEREDPKTADEARRFFETHFVPHEVIPADNARKITGYFEPLLPGSRTQTERYQYPLYRKPDGLIAVTHDNRPDDYPTELQAALETDSGLVIPPDRAAIENGTHGLNLEPLVWLDDPVEIYFVHIQGSARIALEDGSTLRLGYAGKNGHPYASIGREIVRRDLMPLEDITAESLKDWLRGQSCSCC
jgi:membrane-bound lytic murein transglycosylase A